MDRTCEAVVWRRDTYRYTGRTKSGFEMHYAKGRCKRRQVFDGLCTQHLMIQETGVNVSRHGTGKGGEDADE